MTTVAAPPRSPFKGLAAFDDSDVDALFFFGRERERAVIVANLVAAKLTLLYGPSGVGKSSLLAAGVVRELREQVPEASIVLADVWSRELTGIFEDAGAAPEAYVILDQFEEYFLYHEADALLDALPELLERPHVHVLISLREDALAQLDVFKARIPYLFGNQIRLDHLHRQAARAAIVGPVARWNELTGGEVVVEPELVDAVLDQVAIGGGDRVEAPYLQLVLEKLWPTLRVSTLHELGGAEAIVRGHLEGALATLTSPEQDVAAGMFEHLITPSGTKIAHHAGDLAQYAAVPEDALRRVLGALTRDRIVHSVDGSDRYEIFHDVLVDPIQAWRLQRRLDRERRIAARRIRRLAVVAMVAAILLAIVAGVALFALAQRSRARTEARQAHAGELAANALATVGRDPVRSLTLALSAARIERSGHIADVLRTSLLATHLDLIVPTSGAATAEALSPDGRGLLVGDASGHVRLYDTRSARRLRSLRLAGPVTAIAFGARGDSLAAGGNEAIVDHAGPPAVLHHVGVRDAAFGDHGREVATGGGRTVKVWRAGDGQLVQTFVLGGRVSHVAFSPRGDRVAAAWTGSGVRHVALLNVATGNPVADLVGSTAIAFSADGSMLATASTDEFARVYRAADGHRLELLPHGGAVTDVEFSSDSAKLATASADGAAREFDVASGQRLLLMPSGSSAVETARFSGDDRFIVTAGADGAVRLWSSLNGRGLLTLTGHRDAVVSASTSASGRLIASASNDGTVRVWTSGLADQLHLLDRTRGPVVRVGFERSGAVFAAARGGIYLGGRLIRHAHALVDGDVFGSHVAGVSATGAAFLDHHALRVGSPGVHAEFSADGRRLLLVGGRLARLLDVSSGRTLTTVHLRAAASAAAFAPNGSFAVDTSVYAPSGRRVAAARAPATRIVALAFSPDSSRLAAAARNGVAYVWSATTGKLQHALAPAPTPLADIAFSPDGRYVAASAIGGDVRLWTVDHGLLVHVLRRHNGRVARLAFSPDARWLLTAGPTSVGLSQVSTGNLLFYLRGHHAQVEDAAFGANGKEIVTGSDDETVRTYNCDVCTNVYELAKLAHARIVRISTLLTPRERRRYLGG